MLNCPRLLKRRFIWLLAATGLGIALFVFHRHGEPRIGPTNFNKIQFGWTIGQVEQLLGPGRCFSGDWFWGDIVGDTIVVSLDDKYTVMDKHLIHDNLTTTERLYRQTRINARKALNLPPEP